MVVLITGCRSGFGLLSAVTAARAGHIVYAGLRDLNTAGPLIAASQGLRVHPVQLDVNSAADRDAAIARILAEQGRLDALVNNAGIGLHGFLEQVDEDELRKSFEVNVFGVFALTREALPHLRAAKGAIINLSSMSGRVPVPSFGAYAASKFALEGMMEAWRLELAPFGVRVVLVEPAPYSTDLISRNRLEARGMRAPTSPYAPWVEAIDATEAKLMKGALGDPQDVADRVVALLSHPKPTLRVLMGPPGTMRLRLILRDWLPWSLWEALVARISGAKAIKKQP